MALPRTDTKYEWHKKMRAKSSDISGEDIKQEREL